MTNRDPLDEERPRRASRLLDVVLGSLGLILSGPFVALAAVAVRASGDRGPLLYRARRVGENGTPIILLKLRTMDIASQGLPITHENDPRVTRVGRVLRRFKLDELPQFVNVVRGEMSLVGPRPEDPAYVDWTDPLHRFVLGVRPGITGPSQIAFRHEERLLSVPDPDRHYREVVQPAKLAIDAAYLQRRTVRTDLGVIAATVRAILDRG